MPRRKIVITCGDPAGCGPYVALRAIQELLKSSREYEFFLVGDEKILRSFSFYPRVKRNFNLIDAATPGVKDIKKGIPSKLSGRASLGYLKLALEIMPEVGALRLVTAPLSKEAVAKTMRNFSGHTEYLANHFKSKRFEMMMVSDTINTVLYSRHIPLSKVCAGLNQEAILNTLGLVYDSLQKTFRIKHPRIVFASLNPHAGIDTFLGREEALILRAIKKFPHKIHGPYPADTIFTPCNLSSYDCVICAYHDQGMIPFKLLSFYNGVNLTLGLPIIRTSPAHGTAYDLVRLKRVPFHSSMRAAVELAAKLKPSKIRCD